MRATNPIRLSRCISVLSVFVLACGEGATTTAPAPAQLAAGVLANSTAGLTGRIVYVNKTLRIRNLATSTDVNLGISGVNPEFSADGTLITYQVSSGPANKKGIWVMNSDGSNIRRLNACGGSPSFDPTGTMIVFKDNGCTTNGIWKINVNGTGLTKILTGDAHSPAWSADGTQIAYGKIVGPVVQLFTMNADGTNQQQALTSASIIDVAWRPSSKTLFGLLINSSYIIHTYDPTNPSSLTSLMAGGFEPSWSPDGTQIAWAGSGGIWIMNADGSGKQGPVIPNGRQGSWGQ